MCLLSKLEFVTFGNQMTFLRLNNMNSFLRRPFAMFNIFVLFPLPGNSRGKAFAALGGASCESKELDSMHRRQTFALLEPCSV